MRSSSRCVSVVMLALCASLASCKTTSPATAEHDQARSTKEAVAAALDTRLPMALPVHTAGIMRVDLKRLNVFLTRLISLMDANSRRDLTPSEPSGTYASHMAIGVLGALRQRQADGEERKLFLEAIDPEGEVIVAISFQGNDSLIEAMRLGAPLDPLEAIPHGPLYRVSLPALDAKKLVKSLQLNAAKDHVERIEQVGKHVEIDFREQSQNAMRVAARLQPLPIDTNSDTTYLTQQSPALQAFLSSDAAIKVHVPSRSMIPFSALQGINNALMYATPETRTQLQDRGMIEASRAFIFDDPAAYEAIDTTILMDINASEQLSLSMVRGLTPHGVALEQVVSARSPQPVTTLPDPVFSATVAQDFSSSRTSLIMQRELELDANHLQAFHYGGPLTWLSMHAAAPVASRSFMLESVYGKMISALYTEKFHVDATATSFEKPPFTFMLAMDLSLQRPLPAQLTQLGEQWKELIRYTGLAPVTTIKDERVMLLAGAISKDITTRDVTLPERTFAVARLDLQRLVTLMGTFSRDLLVQLPATLFSELSRLAMVQLTGTSHETYTMWHAHTGVEPVPTPPVTPVAAATPESLPGCLFPAIRSSREAQLAILSGSESELIDEMLDTLKKLETSCKEGDAARRVMTARWLMRRARIQPARALDDYSEACTLGVTLACEHRDALKKTR